MEQVDNFKKNEEITPSLGVLREIGDALKFREHLPLYSLRAACGVLGDGREVTPQRVRSCSDTALAALPPRPHGGRNKLGHPESDMCG